MNRLYLALGLVAALGLAWWRYDYVVSDRDAEKLRADQAVENYTTTKAKLDTERQNAADAEQRLKQRIADKEAIENELREKNKCIDAGTCGVRVRWRDAICAGNTVRSSEPGASGSDEETITYDRDFARWNATLEASIEDNIKQIEGLQAELAVKSKPDACVIRQAVR